MKTKTTNNNFVTEGFLEEKIEEFKTEVNSNAQKYRDEILTKLDEVMGELGTIREEQTLGTYQSSELREQVEDHEKRIIKIEQPKA